MKTSKQRGKASSQKGSYSTLTDNKELYSPRMARGKKKVMWKKRKSWQGRDGLSTDNINSPNICFQLLRKLVRVYNVTYNQCSVWQTVLPPYPPQFRKLKLQKSIHIPNIQNYLLLNILFKKMPKC